MPVGGTTDGLAHTMGPELVWRNVLQAAAVPANRRSRSTHHYDFTRHRTVLSSQANHDTVQYFALGRPIPSAEPLISARVLKRKIYRMSAYVVAHVQVTNREEFAAYQTGHHAHHQALQGLDPRRRPWYAARGRASHESQRDPSVSDDGARPRLVELRQPTKRSFPIRLENTDGPAVAYTIPGLDGDVDVPGARAVPEAIRARSSARAWPMSTPAMTRVTRSSSYTATLRPRTSGAT